MKLRKILHLAANPVGTGPLALQEETNEIRHELERARYGRRFDLVSSWATPGDLPHELRRHKPTVVHFSGHGYHAGEPTTGHNAHHREVIIDIGLVEDQRGLIFSTPDGHRRVISNSTLKDTFGVTGVSVRLVVLNACYTEELAAALLAHVDCVVGMGGPIHDDAARAFARGLYAEIGAGADIYKAFEHGRTAIGLDGLPDGDRPRLKIRDGVDPNKLVLATDIPSRPSRRR